MHARQEPPPAERVKELYADLWGQTGQNEVDLSIPIDRIPQLEIGEVIQPIALQEIKDRITKVKNKSAAGTDGVKKCHLMRADTVELLAILFNILLLEGYFPTP